MADKYEFDAIVVGSGISGGWAAKELTEKGLKVIMLERGRNVEHIKDYITANKEPWEFKHRGVRTREMIEDYPVLRRDYALNEEIKHFFETYKQIQKKEVTIPTIRDAKAAKEVIAEGIALYKKEFTK